MFEFNVSLTHLKYLIEMYTSSKIKSQKLNSTAPIKLRPEELNSLCARFNEIDVHLSASFVAHVKKVNACALTNTMSARVSPRLVKHQLRVQTSYPRDGARPVNIKYMHYPETC